MLNNKNHRTKRAIRDTIEAQYNLNTREDCQHLLVTLKPTIENTTNHAHVQKSPSNTNTDSMTSNRTEHKSSDKYENAKSTSRRSVTRI